MKNANHAAGADFSEAVFSLEYGNLFPIGSGTGKKLQEFRSYRIKMGIMPRALFSETRSFPLSTAILFQWQPELGRSCRSSGVQELQNKKWELCPGR
ncbi:MAG: hypothetical protein QOI53_1613 [Verrucomicrobiota bacterium]|nr:hypothetical protein [Verrucomicrobiota bacterium]